MKFKVGDRVVGTRVEFGIDLRGKNGKVVSIDKGRYCLFPVGVAFDKPFAEGHTCSAVSGKPLSKNKHGWWCSDLSLSHEGSKKKRGQKVNGSVWSGYAIIEKKNGKPSLDGSRAPRWIFSSLQRTKDVLCSLVDYSYSEKTHTIKKVSLVIDK